MNSGKSRRHFLHQTGLLLSGSFVSFPTVLIAQESAASDNSTGEPSIETLNRYPRALHDFYIRRVRELEKEANQRRASLKTKSDAERYIAEVQEKISRCFGQWPEKTPLNPQITRIHEREGYRIENVIFESRSDFPVTANLYIPTAKKGPYPGVVAPCGHSPNGKAARSYQSFAQGLVKQGYVVLIFDPMGQGERIQHLKEDLTPRFGIATQEHTYVGNRLILVDENLPAWFAWDGIRALDYLITRPEVDTRHLGVTGNSGGGTQTTWLCAAESRFTMAAPSCFVTTLRRNIENELSQDSEQYPWHMLALGLDHSDFIAAMAPRPVRILGQEHDYFDARGFEEAAGRLNELYQLLGVEENFSSFLGPDPHGYSQPNREAMYGWFNQITGSSTGSREPELQLENDETLRCTDTGHATTAKTATIFTIGREKSRKLAASRPRLDGAALRQAITNTLRIPDRSDIADYRILRPSPNRRYPLNGGAHYVLETEPGIPIVVTRVSPGSMVSRPPKGLKKALLYIPHRSSDSELRSDPWLEELIRKDPKSTATFACDLRGVGESKPSISGPKFHSTGGTDYFHAGIGLMLDRPMPGQRTFDLLRVLDWLESLGHKEIHLVARGEGTIPATFAAVLHDSVTQVTLRHGLNSYAEIAETETYRWPLSSLVPGILARFDLPDCYNALEAKSLEFIEPAGPGGVPSLKP